MPRHIVDHTHTLKRKFKFSIPLVFCILRQKTSHTKDLAPGNDLAAEMCGTREGTGPREGFITCHLLGLEDVGAEGEQRKRGEQAVGWTCLCRCWSRRKGKRL